MCTIQTHETRDRKGRRVAGGLCDLRLEAACHEACQTCGSLYKCGGHYGTISLCRPVEYNCVTYTCIPVPPPSMRTVELTHALSKVVEANNVLRRQEMDDLPEELLSLYHSMLTDWCERVLSMWPNRARRSKRLRR